MRLHEYIAAARPFEWERNNCAHFAAGWARPGVLAGVPMPDGPRGVRQALRAIGAASLRQAVTRVLGPELPAPALAQPGDVVLVGRSLGLCNGRHAALLATDGVAYADMTAAEAAWRVAR